jgi:hypothetical protein
MTGGRFTLPQGSTVLGLRDTPRGLEMKLEILLPAVDRYAIDAASFASYRGLRDLRRYGRRYGAGETVDARAGFGTAARAAAGTFRQLNESVDFPRFVSDLVQGVFTAIVDSSIKQMEAYGKLVQDVVKSAEEFRSDHVKEAQGMAFLCQKFPNVFQQTGSGDETRLEVKDDVDDELPNVQKALGLERPIEDLRDEEALKAVIIAAQTELARSRQRLLATMILMGINRIIVTEGKINARVHISVHANDKRTTTDSDTRRSGGAEGGGAFSLGSFGLGQQQSSMSISTVKSNTGRQDLKTEADLAGEVTINFRSETFPLEQMVNTDMIQRLGSIQAGNAEPAGGTAAGGPGAGREATPPRK